MRSTVLRPSLARLMTAALTATALAAQSRLPSHRVSNNLPAPFATGGYGEQILALGGDLDGDGFADYAVAAPGASEPLGQGTPGGVVYLHGGRTGAILGRLVGTQPSARFGASMVCPGDVSGDGVPDIAVAASQHDSNGLGNNGRVTMFDGSTGAVLWTVDGDNQGDALGTCLAVGPDVSGDGVSDLVVGEPGYSVNGLGRGRVRIVESGAGATLGFADGPLSLSGFGTTAAGAPTALSVFVGDAVGRVYELAPPVGGVWTPSLFDAKPPGNHVAVALALVETSTGGHRLICGRATTDMGGTNTGSVDVFELAGARVFQRIGTVVTGSYGARVALGRDLDADGEQEVLVAGGGGTGAPAFIEVLRQDGSLLDTLVTECTQFPAIASLTDVTGDGRGELLVATASGLCGLAEAWVVGNGLSVRSAGTTATGAYRATFDVDLGAVNAGRAYWQLYGMSGTTPGYAGIAPWPLVPLVLDDTTTVMDQLAGSVFTPDSKGRLDASGRASTRLFVPPPIASALAGVEISTSVVVLDTTALAVFAASNPVRWIMP